MCIKQAIDGGAGLVVMLDGSTVKILVPLIEILNDCAKKDTKKLDVKLPITWFDEVKDITFRPILTKDGKNHEAMKLLIDKVLPPFGSINRSYYRMLARKDDDTKVLMEIPEYLDQKPIIPPAWINKDGSPNDNEYRVDQAYPFVVVRPPIVVMAADWCNTGGREFVRWQHASIWLASLACAATGLKMEELKMPPELEEPCQQIESEEPVLKAKSAESPHWFLNEDRKYFIPKWEEIESKLSTPVEEPASQVIAKAQAKIGPRDVYELPCPRTTDVTKDNDYLEVKLCNDIVVTLNKLTMQVGYHLKRAAGEEMVLAKTPVDSSHTPWFWNHETVTYQGYRIEGANLGVRCAIHENGTNPPVGHLVWTFIPQTKVIEGVEWTCIGEQFELKTGKSVETFYVPPHQWKLGDEIARHSTRRFACYGGERYLYKFEVDEQIVAPENASKLLAKLRDKGLPLNDEAELIGEVAGEQWAILDPDATYLLTYAKPKLTVKETRRGFMHVRFDDDGFLFNIKSEHIDDALLDPNYNKNTQKLAEYVCNKNGESELCKQFGEHHIPIDENAKIEKLEDEKGWMISYYGRRFYVQRADEESNVYKMYKETTSEPVDWFCDGQPFQMLTYSGNDVQRTLLCYTTMAASIRTEMYRLPKSAHTDSDYIDIDLQVNLGRQTGTIQLPTFWYCFAEEDFSHNLWLSAYDHVRKHFQSEYAIERTHPKPTTVMRYNHSNINDLRNYADIFIPLAKAMGFKRIDCGVHCIADLFFQLHGGIDALRYLCDKASAAGIEILLYSGATWMYGEHPAMGFLPDAPGYHPDWFVQNRKGEIERYQGGDDTVTRDGLTRRIVVLSLRSGWYQYSLDQYAEFKRRTGVNGVWLDSWTWPNQYVNYAEPNPKPTVAEAMQYVADLQKLGYTVLVEGQSPAALESFWYHPHSYAPLRGNEFCLSGMSPFASNGDGLLGLDLFRLLAYGSVLFQDIRLLADATDDAPNKVTKLAKACNKMMNSIYETIGLPQRVRELSMVKRPLPVFPSLEKVISLPIDIHLGDTEDAENAPIGTFWACERGIAIFGLQTVWDLDIDLDLSIRDPHKIHVAQHNIRGSESPLITSRGPQNMQIVNISDKLHLQGNLSAGDVVVIQAALGEESTDIFLPIIQA